MSKLTWDNLDDWIRETPKDENGHFITPKPVKKEVPDFTSPIKTLLKEAREKEQKDFIAKCSGHVDAKGVTIFVPVFSIDSDAGKNVEQFAKQVLKQHDVTLVDWKQISREGRPWLELRFDFANDDQVVEFVNKVFPGLTLYFEKSEQPLAVNVGGHEIRFGNIVVANSSRGDKDLHEFASELLSRVKDKPFQDPEVQKVIEEVKNGLKEGETYIACFASPQWNGTGYEMVTTSITYKRVNGVITEDTLHECEGKIVDGFEHRHLSNARETPLAEAMFPTVELKAEKALATLGENLSQTHVNDNLKIDVDQAEQQHDPLARAKHALKDLDTTEAEEEFAAAAAGIEYRKGLANSGLLRLNNSPLMRPNMTPEELKQYHEELKAYHEEVRKAVVARMDGELESGGRVAVSEKYLLNCKADLNQLIPFKYVWAWDFYIRSNEHHWMPGEFSLDRCKSAFSALTLNEKKIIARAYWMAEMRKRLFPETVLVNFYRLCTNPEVREYQLRQGMEFLQTHHAWMEMCETFNIRTLVEAGFTLKDHLMPVENDTFKSWYRETIKHTKYAHDLSSVTNTTQGMVDFIKSYVLLHMHTNFIALLVPYYQVIHIAKKHPGLEGMGKMFEALLRDIRMQFGFAKLFLKQLLDENNEYHTNELIGDIMGAFKTLVDNSTDFASSLSNDSDEYHDIVNVINHYTDEVYSIVNPMHENRKLNSKGERGLKFISLVEASIKAKEHGPAGNGALGDSW